MRPSSKEPRGRALGNGGKNMKPFHAFVLAGVLALAPLFAVDPAAAQTSPAVEKMNAYVGCINRLSGRAYDSRARYFSWAAKSGPTGHERIIYGLYTIYDTSGCRAGIEKANALEPHDAELEAAATAYGQAVGKLETLLKEADDYYTQQDYKDDKMTKGRALHPLLVAAWDAFASADQKLRAGVESINDKRALDKLASIEQSEGKSARYHVEALMIKAKSVMRKGDGANPNLGEFTVAVAEYDNIVKEAEQFAGSDRKIGSFFMNNATSFLTTAKALMRRLRDHVPYSTGDKMMLSNPGSGWMVEGSPPRLMRDYNQLVDAYNRGAGF
jgi:hypothetical protein